MQLHISTMPVSSALNGYWSCPAVLQCDTVLIHLYDWLLAGVFQPVIGCLSAPSNIHQACQFTVCNWLKYSNRSQFLGKTLFYFVFLKGCTVAGEYINQCIFVFPVSSNASVNLLLGLNNTFQKWLPGWQSAFDCHSCHNIV